jgi:hypothetical protein
MVKYESIILAFYVVNFFLECLQNFDVALHFLHPINSCLELMKHISSKKSQTEST